MISRKVTMLAAALLVSTASVAGAANASAQVRPGWRPPPSEIVETWGYGPTELDAYYNAVHTLQANCNPASDFVDRGDQQLTDGSWKDLVQATCY